MPTFLTELNRDAIPLSRALRECFPPSRTGRAPHLSTGFRWVRDGVVGPDGNRIYLEATRIGGALFVTPASCERFIVAMNTDMPRNHDKEEADVHRRAKETAAALAEFGI